MMSHPFKQSIFIKMRMIGCCILLISSFSEAKEWINLPQEELAQESVYPVFDTKIAVKNRNITTEDRWDTHIFYGIAMTEPIANVSKLGLGVYYNWNENHNLGFLFAQNATGLSRYANQLSTEQNLDFNRAPRPKSVYLLDYNLKAFYGKMSLTKKMVYNLSLYGSLAGGAIQYEHKTYPALVPGLGQKFYFDKNWALRFDLRLYIHQAPIPFLEGKIKKTDPVPALSAFDERITYTTNLDIGLSYLF